MLSREPENQSMGVPIQAFALRPSHSIRQTDTQDGAVLLDVEQGICFSMNLIGTLIWKLLGSGSRPDEIAQHLATTFDIPFDQASADVQDFLEQLQRQKLLQRPDKIEPRPKRNNWVSTMIAKIRQNRRKRDMRDAGK